MARSNVWMSVSDLMTGLMVIFLFVAIAYIKRVQDNQTVLTQYVENRQDLHEKLVAEFKEEAEQGKVSIHGDLSMRFENAQTLFAPGSSMLSPVFREELANYIPRYLGILLKASMKDKIREITSRSRGDAFSAVVQELNAYIRGWINYYARSNIHSYIKEKAAWIRRRLRQYLWKQWKTPSNRRDKLQELGIPKWRLDKINCYSSCRWYKISSILSPYITNNTLFNKFNLVDIEGEYKRLHRERRLLDRTYNSQSEFVFI